MACNKSVQELAGEIDTTSLTEETSIDPNADFVPVYDTSVAALRKAKPKNLNAFRGCLLNKSAAQSIADSTATFLTWDTEVFDTSGFHDNATNNTRITIPAGISYVQLSGNLDWAANTTGARTIDIFKNGAATAGGGRIAYPANTATASAERQISSAPLAVSEGDYFELRVFQNSGGALDVDATTNATWFALRVLG